jgi:hypothetical protein
MLSQKKCGSVQTSFEAQAQMSAGQSAVATELNRRGMMTRRGGKWGVGNVLNLMLRVDALPR